MKKKLTPVSKLRAKVTELNRALSAAEQDARLARQRVGDLVVQLREARRRTLPVEKGFAGGGMDINFYPIVITKIEIAQETKDIESWTGERATVKGFVRATLEVEGNSLEFQQNREKEL